MDIAELVKKAQEGDSSCFAEIYDQFANRIYRFILIKIGHKQQAEDILQEVFIKAWNALSSLSLENLNFNAWIYKVASNTINDYFRKVYRTPQILELNEDLGIKASNSVSEEIQLKGDLDFMKQALGTLPANYSQVLELRFIQDFSLDETAQVLGKTNLAVRVLQHRALKLLRAELEKKYVYGYKKI